MLNSLKYAGNLTFLDESVNLLKNLVCQAPCNNCHSLGMIPVSQRWRSMKVFFAMCSILRGKTDGRTPVFYRLRTSKKYCIEQKNLYVHAACGCHLVATKSRFIFCTIGVTLL